MSVEMVTVLDERGEAIFFVDTRTAGGSLVASEWFATERDAREWLTLNGGEQ